MKKILSLLLTTVMLMSVLVFNVEANDGRVNLEINGEMKKLVAYNIKGNNYFKLRDVANVLKGTSAEFDVIWNAEKGAIELKSKTPYSTNEELTKEALKKPVAKSSYVNIYKDGFAIVLGAYSIAGNNYFKLRDIASAMDFYVGWNAASKVISIDTSKSYEHPTSSVFGVNPQYFSLLGKSKGEIDKILGESIKYDSAMARSMYENGICIGWSTVYSKAENIPDTEHPKVMYIPINRIFYNCPDTINIDTIRSQFNSWRGNDYSFMVNYCGKALMFDPFNQTVLPSSTRARIVPENQYADPNVEVIQINN